MKKSLVIALALVFVLGIAGTALAANPFVDVPAKHWAYGAVDQLYKAGIVDGVSAGKYAGDKTMTRYEMAQIVAKAMVKSDKADAATKATIDKLAVEFASELNNLGVRVAKLEKNASTIKFSAQVKELYENEAIDDVTTESGYTHRMRLFMKAPVGDNYTFTGRLAMLQASGAGSATAAFDQYNISGTVGGVEFVYGRQPMILGAGAEWNYQTALGTSSSWDGLKLGFGSPDLKLYLANVKRNGAAYYIGDLTGKLDSGKLLLNAMYLKTAENAYAPAAQSIAANGAITAAKDNAVGDGSGAYDTTTIGLRYNGFDNIYLLAEAGKNKAQNDAKITHVLARYNMATRNQVNSWDVFAGYMKADRNFDPVGYAGLDYLGNQNLLNQNNDFKGMNLGFDLNVAKDAILTFNYFTGERITTGEDRKALTTYLLYWF